jgi:glycerol-3-phosphate dehydrogenase (NAD(P)+)
MATVTIVGAGMMGSALAVPLADRGHSVRLVGTPLDAHIIECLQAGKPHPTLKQSLPGAIRPLPVTALDDALSDTDVIALGVSSAGVRWAAAAIARHAHPDRPILMITKGLDRDATGLRILPDQVQALLPAAVRDAIHPVAVAGPCIAGELARRVPTCVAFTGRSPAVAEHLAALSRGPYYHAFVEEDVVGAEVCAALKNAYAMGIALAAGLHERAGGAPGSVAMHNYEAAVFAQSVAEMRRLVRALGGRPRTVAGLCGVGDLDVTCNGGRTGRFGRWLGLGLGVKESIARMEGATLECLEILEVLRAARPALERTGALEPDALPLLDHLTSVALDDAPVAMPFERFFGASAP